jgi:hypothetical protein
MTYQHVQLSKRLYKCGILFPKEGKNLSEVLEALDPSDQYKRTSLEGLDAFSRQLRRFDIKVSGPDSDTISKFFQNEESSILFPEYVRLAVKKGMEEADILPEIVASVTEIDGLDYRSISSNLAEPAHTVTSDLNSSSCIPSADITTNTNLARLYKRGRMLTSSYEALRYQRIELFTITLKQIGANIARAHLRDAIKTIVEGDGSNGACRTVTPVSGELSYNSFISMWEKLSPFNLKTILVPTFIMRKILNMPELRDSVAKASAQNTNTIITPLGAKIIPTNVIDEKTIIGLDSDCALEMIKASDIVVDYDKLIDKQFERATITSTVGFSKIFTDASIKLEG